MPRTSLKRMRSFIEMYDMQDELQVQLCLDPAMSPELYVVTHKLNDEDSNEYFCKTVAAAGECVSHIVFNVAMVDNLEPIE